MSSGNETRDSTDANATPARDEKNRSPSERRALQELRTRLELFISGNGEHKVRSPVRQACTGMSCPVDSNRQSLGDVSLWGVPLLPSRGHEGTDVILLKFLQAREFDVSEALEMIQKTLTWRREFGIDGILEEDLGLPEIQNAVYMDCEDREGHPLVYNVYGALSTKDVYQKTFGSDEKRDKFLRWRVQFMEKSIKKLSFKEGGVGSMLQITDLKNSPGPAKKEVRTAISKALVLLQDNYPEFVAKNIFINVPFRCYAYHALFSRFLTTRTKSKFIFARPGKVTKTLLKFIAPENLPIQYGGLKREKDNEFSDENGVSELVVRGGCTGTIKLPIAEPGVTVVWDLTVVGWEVSYKEEFIPNDDCSYQILIHKEKKLEEGVRNSFYINEPGKLVLTVVNRTFKKKKIFYRSKTKPTVPLYNFFK